MDENQRWARRTWMLLVGVFAVIVAVNMGMAFLAVRSSTGLVSPTAYEGGLAYNATLATKASEQALGWRVVRVREGFPAVLTYTVAGQDGAPLTGVAAVADVVRPVGVGGVSGVVLTERDAGVYEAKVPWPAAGQWVIKLKVTKDGKGVDMVDRVIVP